MVSDSAQAQIDGLLARLNPPQQEAVTHGDGPMLIFAGAGSGKTRVLTARIGYLIAAGHIDSRLVWEYFSNSISTWWGWLQFDCPGRSVSATTPCCSRRPLQTRW